MTHSEHTKVKLLISTSFECDEGGAMLSKARGCSIVDLGNSLRTEEYKRVIEEDKNGQQHSIYMKFLRSQHLLLLFAKIKAQHSNTPNMAQIFCW